MKEYKAFTLMEMLIVMTIMVIILGLGMSAYVTFTETTKYNEDVANIQQDILNMQRAAMLFKKEDNEGWVYGLGIDFEGVINGDGTYKYFKWCSEYRSYAAGGEQTNGIYPNYIKDSNPPDSNGMDLSTSYTITECTIDPLYQDYGQIISLSGYGLGYFRLGSGVSMNDISDCDGSFTPCTPRFLLFEAVTGRAFVFDNTGALVPPDKGNMTLTFEKNFGATHNLEIKHLTGKTNLYIPTP